MADNVPGWNEDAYVSLLEKLVGETKHLQNKPPHLIPQESLVGNHVEQFLKPHLKENGGVLTMERIEYAKGRNNIIITYPGPDDKVVSFVGSHMDVVAANPEEWQKADPFKFKREGDQLFGRGTTDCLGHVALLSVLLAHIAETKPKFSFTLVVVFIANEENAEIPDIGVDGLVKNGKMAHLKKGPMFWIDASDKQPCIGTGTMMPFELLAKGRQGHSGLPFDAVNSLILAYEALMEMMRKFHNDFPAHPKEKDYGFKGPSTMKPTMWEHPPGAINQIPGQAKISGDIRATPFYDPEEIKKAVAKYVDEINANIGKLPMRGPNFFYEVSDTKGRIEFKWLGTVHRGIACNLESPGFKAISKATTEVLGECKPYSITGTLPLVYDLKEEGFDLQVTGYGLSKYYHGVDEFCNLSDMKKGFAVFSRVLALLNE